MQGLYCWNRHTLEAFAEAARFFERAVERDINFAQAHTNLAYAHLMLRKSISGRQRANNSVKAWSYRPRILSAMPGVACTSQPSDVRLTH